MKNRKRLMIAGGAALALALVVVNANFRSRQKNTGEISEGRDQKIASMSSRVDANFRSRQKSDGEGSEGRDQKIASTNVAASVPATQTPTKRGTLPFVLTSKTPFDKPLRLAAEALGARTVSSVSRKRLLVEATPEARARLKADARFEDIVEFAPAQKIQPALAALVEKGEKTVEVSILALDAVDRETVIAALTANGGEMLKGCINEGDTIRAKIPADAVAALAGRGEVRWMERFVRPVFTNDQAVKPEAMNVVSVWDTSRDLGLTGAGQKITTSDSGIDTGSTNTMHRDLRERVKGIYVYDGCDAGDYNGHGTHTAGSIVGDGTNCDGRYRGTAHAAELYAWFCGAGGGRSVYHPTSPAELFRPDGVDAYIHSASWGSGFDQGIHGDYTTDCRSYDDYVWKNPEFLPVFSAGNDGDYGSQTVGSPGSAKNVLAVGATVNLPGDPSRTAYFSSRGPCKDGRTKPDISAPGYSITSTRSSLDGGSVTNGYTSMAGTSMSCPLTAGSVALVRQWLMEKKGFDGVEVSPGVTNRLPTAALMKAVIMGGAKGAAVPGNDQGWGRVDLANTLAPSDGCAVKLIDRIPFAAGFVTNIVIETTSAAPLDVQLVWIDYPGDASGDQTESRLVNDLDLTVEPYGIGGDFCYGNGGEEPDTLNNAESVRIASAAVGKYIITIDCKTILHDHTEGGAAALYIRGAFDPEANPEAPKCVHLEKLGEDFFSVDAALAAVRDDGEKVSIMRPARLQKAVTVPTNCTLVADAVDPAVDPFVLCTKRSLVTVPEGVSFAVSGVAFTNDFAGFSVEGTLAANNAIFEDFAAVSVSTNGQATFGNVAVGGAAPTIATETNSVVSLSGFTVAGAASDWSVAGSLALEGVRLADNQAVTVGPKGALTIGAGVTNLTAVTLEDATKDSLKLGAALVQSIEIVSPKACAQGQIFGSYTCDYGTAADSAAHFVDVLDPEGELGGQANSADESLRWAVVEAPAEAAGARVNDGSGWKHYYGFNSALRVATNANSTLMLVKDSAYDRVAALSHDLTLTSTNGASLAFGQDAGFVIPAGTHLLVTNAVISGAGDAGNAADSQKAIGFSVTGGELILEDGAVLTGFSSRYATHKDTAYYGGTVVVNPGTFTMRSGSCISNCDSHNQGGAVWLGGAKATANLLGGTITNCSADAAGGAVYAWGNSSTGATVNVAGDFVAVDNKTGSALSPAPGNLYLMRMAPLKVSSALTGAVGVSFSVKSGMPDLNDLEANFVALGCELTPQALTNSAACFANDVNTNLVGGCVEGQIVWAEPAVDDGRCEEDAAGVRVKVDGESGYRFYSCIDDAFEYVKTNATFEVKGFVSGDTDVCDCLTKDVTIDHDVRITSWKGFTYNESDIMILWRTYHAMYKVVAGGSLTLSNVKLVGACSWDEDDEDPWDDEPWCSFTPLFYEDTDPEKPVEEPSLGYGLITVDGGSLTLEDGARVGYVFGNTSRSSNAITVFNGGTVTMESGSRVMEVDNQYVDDYETGCGGGILLDRSTGYFRGGAIFYCKAYRAGGLYVANGSTAYVSGSIYIDDNESWKRLFDQGPNTDISDNVVVSKNSKLVLAGPLESASPWSDDPENPDPGFIGVNESLAGDTNWFGYVSEDWNWDYDTLINSAAYFRHDKRSEVFSYICGTAVTNWNAKAQRWDARLVWEDSLLSPANGITIDGQTYRGAIPAGLTVAVPTAFSVTTTTGANGNLALSLDGGVAGCWYTVYSTTDLSQPFTAEKSIQLKAGETFEFEVDQTAGAKFYKIVAEEGLK